MPTSGPWELHDGDCEVVLALLVISEAVAHKMLNCKGTKLHGDRQTCKENKWKQNKSGVGPRSSFRKKIIKIRHSRAKMFRHEGGGPKLMPNLPYAARTMAVAASFGLPGCSSWMSTASWFESTSQMPSQPRITALQPQIGHKHRIASTDQRSITMPASTTQRSVAHSRRCLHRCCARRPQPLACAADRGAWPPTAPIRMLIKKKQKKICNHRPFFYGTCPRDGDAEIEKELRHG